ncbi:hypothetical protein AB0E69_32575 [Kribbella sp. NPDC026611]|uniref:uridine kinase family protein n=1 Tax=Kribbella sp. NPDC026611 TaxID=3154911 RepID=UPI0033C9E013
MEIAAAVRGLRVDGRPVLVGVEGYGGSGKSTFAAKLAEALGDAYVVGIDDFIVKDRLADTPWDEGAFDHARLERQVLAPARAGQTVAYQKLIWETDELGAPVTVPPIGFLIVEGISAYLPSLAKYYDYKIWVDTPIEIASARGRARDGSNENAAHWDRWATFDLAYQTKYHPEKTADAVANGLLAD